MTDFVISAARAAICLHLERNCGGYFSQSSPDLDELESIAAAIVRPVISGSGNISLASSRAIAARSSGVFGGGVPAGPVGPQAASASIAAQANNAANFM